MAWTEKYVTTGGTEAWATNSAVAPSSITEAIAQVNAGERVNIKAGTYTMGADYVFARAGTTTQPVWWRGYKTDIGDMDGFGVARVAGTDIPKITATNVNYQLSVTAICQMFSNIEFNTVSQETNGTMNANATNGGILFLRCRFINTSENASSRAFTHTAAPTYLIGCYLSATDTANYCFYAGTGGANIIGCTIHGGIVGAATGGAFILNSIFDNQVTTAISSQPGTASSYIIGNTIYSSGGDAIKCIAVPTSGSVVYANNIFASNGGYGINQNTGADTFLVKAFSNLYYGNGTEGSVGLVEQGYSAGWTTLSTAMLAKLDTTDPIPNATTDDFSLAGTSLAVAGAFPGAFENETTVGYLDHGAAQKELGECINIIMGDDSGRIIVQEA